MDLKEVEAAIRSHARARNVLDALRNVEGEVSALSGTSVAGALVADLLAVVLPHLPADVQAVLKAGA